MSDSWPSSRQPKACADPIADRGAGSPEVLQSSPDAGGLIEDLYRKESQSLLRGVARAAGHADDAQDLVQEAFLRLARLKEQALLLERPQAFLKRIAANLLKDRARSNSRRRPDLHSSIDDDILRAPDPVRLLESRDMLNRIEAAMMRLRPRTREIFMAHRIDGLSYAEIAERTGLSQKGVEKQMSKALQQLDRLIGR